jgi:hypothetical protein
MTGLLIDLFLLVSDLPNRRSSFSKVKLIINPVRFILHILNFYHFAILDSARSKDRLQKEGNEAYSDFG